MNLTRSQSQLSTATLIHLCGQCSRFISVIPFVNRPICFKRSLVYMYICIYVHMIRIYTHTYIHTYIHNILITRHHKLIKDSREHFVINSVIISASSRVFVTIFLELFLTIFNCNETVNCCHRKLHLG